jgi:hypothetical protein
VVSLTDDIYDHNKFIVLAIPRSNSEIFGVYKYPPQNATLFPGACSNRMTRTLDLGITRQVFYHCAAFFSQEICLLTLMHFR